LAWLSLASVSVVVHVVELYDAGLMSLERKA